MPRNEELKNLVNSIAAFRMSCARWEELSRGTTAAIVSSYACNVGRYLSFKSKECITTIIIIWLSYYY